MRKNALLICSVLVIGLFGCNKEGCQDPQAFNYNSNATEAGDCIYPPVQVESQVNMIQNGTQVEVGESILLDGRPATVTRLSMYISRPSFETSATWVDWEQDLFLLTKDDNQFETTFYPDGAITGLRFSLGPDSSLNHVDPSLYDVEHPLGPKSPTMHWSWAAGYRFFVVEGEVDTSAAKDGSQPAPFLMHIGNDEYRTLIELDIEQWEVTDAAVKLDIGLDLDLLFKDVDWVNDRLTHTNNNIPLAEKMVDNLKSAFVIR